MTRLIEELGRLPGIGPRTAERLASHLLLLDKADAMRLAIAIRDLKRDLVRCEICCNFAEATPCPICADAERDERSICVVEEPRDLAAIEASGVHAGRYHVLGGRLAPLEGERESSLTLPRLVERIAAQVEGDARPVEIIIATNPNLEGEGTALRVVEALESEVAAGRCVVTRIATGLPTGTAIEYVHREVLADAYLGRRNFTSGVRS